MKNLRNISLVAIATTVMFASCKKEDPVTPPSTNPVPGTSNLGTFFDDNIENSTQHYTIDASSWNSIIGNDGTKIYISAGSFQDASGTPVTGIVDIELIEILSIKDVIMTDKPTTSGGEMLTTGGELSIEAFQAGQELGLTPSANITFMVPTDAPDNNMGLFLGIEDANGDVDWVPSDSLGVTDSVIVVGDTTGSGGWSDYYYFNITSDSLGWINCDYFTNDPNPRTNIEVVPNSGHDQTNTDLYLYVQSANSVIGSWYNVSSFQINNIPETTVGTIIAISEISGQYYSAFVPITVVNSHVENITLAPTTLAQFETDLDNL